MPAEPGIHCPEQAFLQGDALAAQLLLDFDQTVVEVFPGGRHIHFLLAGEVQVQPGLGDARGPGQIVHRGLPVAVAAEGGDGRIKDRLTWDTLCQSLKR